MQFGLEMDGISVREFEVAVDFKYGNSTFLQIIAEIGLVIYSIDSIGYSPAWGHCNVGDDMLDELGQFGFCFGFTHWKTRPGNHLK